MREDAALGEQGIDGIDIAEQNAHGCDKMCLVLFHVFPTREF